MNITNASQTLKIESFSLVAAFTTALTMIYFVATSLLA